MYETPLATAARQDAGCFVDYDARSNLGKQRAACGFSWLLRVADHEAVLVDPDLFSSLVHRSVVLLKRMFGRQTSSRWLFSLKNDWIAQVIPQHAIKAIRVLSTRKIVAGRQKQKLRWHVLQLNVRRQVFTAACCVERQLHSFILSEMGANTGHRAQGTCSCHFYVICDMRYVRDQLRDQRGQRRRYWPPFAPWVQ
jgi:hypothetical protein